MRKSVGDLCGHLQARIYREILRLKRRTYITTRLSEFRKAANCSSALIRASSMVEVPGPRFINTAEPAGNPAEKVTVRAPPLEIVEFSNAAVMGGINIVLVGNEAIHADMIEPDRDMFLGEVEGVAKFTPGSRKLTLPGPPLRPNSPRKTLHFKEGISLLGDCSGNYAHWILEVLSKLAEIDEQDKYKSVPILVDGWVYPKFYESLAVLNSNYRPIHRVNRWQMASLDRLIYITPPSYVAAEDRRFHFTGEARPASPDSFQFSAETLTMLRNKAVAAAKKFAPSGTHLRGLPTVSGVGYSDGLVARLNKMPKPEYRYSDAKRVYLRRVAASAGNPRQMLGNEHVETLLSDFGFIAADPADLSFVEQVLLLQNAECVVAPIGAALANLIFAPPGKKVIALSPYYRDADYYYFANMLGILGHDLYYIVGPQVDQPNVHRLHRNYFVDLQALKQALQRFLG